MLRIEYRKYGISMALPIILCLAFPTAARQKAVRQSKEVQAIRTVLGRQVEAWNRQDLEGFMVGYWNSPGLTFYSGATKTSGWQPTLDRYRKRYQGEGKEMGRLEFSDLQIELLGPESAFVRGHWQLKMSTGESSGLFTLILRKLPAGWRIVHDHTGSV